MGDIAQNLEQNRVRIAREGTKAAKARFEFSRGKILKAMSDIEVDIEKHRGIYPYSEGRISAAEVLRRAGMSEAYLRKREPPSLVHLKKEVDSWVERVTAEIATGARVVRRKITRRIESAEAELNSVRQAYAEAELQHNETILELNTAHAEIEKLRMKIADLLKELSDKTVVELRRQI